MKKILLFLILTTPMLLNAATVTWDGGAGTTNWMDAMNWDTDAIPTMADDVSLDDDIVVLSANTQVQRIFANGSTSLTINSGVTLTIDGFTGNDEGLEIQGSATLINDGTIVISNILGGSGADGLYNKGTCINNGNISIDGIAQHGMYLVAGLFTNASGGTITVTNIGQVNGDGDYVYLDDANSGTLFGTMVNDGTITIISTTGDDGIHVNDNATLNNNSMVIVSATGGDEAVYVEDGGTFNNNSGGVIMLNSTGDMGISGKNSGVFNNNLGGTINIGAITDDQIFLDDITLFNNAGVINLTDAVDLALYVTDASVFTNTATGEVNITNSTDHSVYIDGNSNATGASVINAGTITITGGGGSSDGVRMGEVAAMTNDAGGSLLINNAGADGIQMDGNTTFNNSGMISIDGTGAGQEALELVTGSTFNNLMGGVYMVANCPDDGIEVNNGATFANDGAIEIDGSGSEDIELFTGATFTNTANATFAPGSSPGDLEIKGVFDMGTSTTTFEITGTTPITDYDVIVHSSSTNAFTISAATAHLDWGTFVPTVGDEFKLLDRGGSGTTMGPFAAFTTTNPSIVYTVNYDNNDVLLQITEILAVELTSFKGSIEDATTFLTWETSLEENNDYFQVEHSTNGRDFSPIGKVNGNGHSVIASSYKFVHESPANNDNYYRLKQVDFDGHFEYFNTVYLQNKMLDITATIYPNPAHAVLTYQGTAGTLTFYDAYGKIALQQTTTAGKENIDISQLEAGIYTIEILSNNSKVFKRFIKQ